MVAHSRILDPILGNLTFSRDEDLWEASASVGGHTVNFKISGSDQPDAGLVRHAQDIVRGFGPFQQLVHEFLMSEATGKGSLEEEILDLEIEDICLFWPKRPDDGMIYFKGPSEVRVWRCDYLNRRPRNLGFDV